MLAAKSPGGYKLPSRAYAMTHGPARMVRAIALSSALLVACAPAAPITPTATPSPAAAAPAASPAPAVVASPSPSVAAAKPAASPPAAISVSPSPVRGVPSPSAAASPVAGAAAAAAAAGPAPPGDAAHGQQVFLTEGCYACHGTVGQGASTGPRLAPGPLPFAAFQQQVRQPRQDMPRFTAQVLSDQDLADVYAYIQSIQPGPAATTIPLLRP
jgi:mono/diheme cytochrome c family protein